MKTDKKVPVENPVEKPVENSQKTDTINELTADLQRTRADFENYRKQVELQREKAVQLSQETTVASILPLLDQLQLAIKTYEKELAPLAKTFDKTLADFHLSLVDSSAGTDFNPDLHEAVMVEDGDGEREVVSETLRPGYYYQKEVLRPAMVKVKRTH